MGRVCRALYGPSTRPSQEGVVDLDDVVALDEGADGDEPRSFQPCNAHGLSTSHFVRQGKLPVSILPGAASLVITMTPFCGPVWTLVPHVRAAAARRTPPRRRRRGGPRWPGRPSYPCASRGERGRAVAV